MSWPPIHSAVPLAWGRRMDGVELCAVPGAKFKRIGQMELEWVVRLRAIVHAHNLEAGAGGAAVGPARAGEQV